MLDDRIAYRAAAAGDQIDGASRDTRFVKCFDEAIRTQGRERRGLDDHRVSRDEGGSHFPGRNGAREIPRRDQTDDAERLAHRVAENFLAFGRNLVAELTRAFAAEVSKDVNGALHLAFGFG